MGPSRVAALAKAMAALMWKRRPCPSTWWLPLDSLHWLHSTPDVVMPIYGALEWIRIVVGRSANRHRLSDASMNERRFTHTCCRRRTRDQERHSGCPGMCLLSAGWKPDELLIRQRGRWSSRHFDSRFDMMVFVAGRREGAHWRTRTGITLRTHSAYFVSCLNEQRQSPTAPKDVRFRSNICMRHRWPTLRTLYDELGSRCY